MSLEELQVRDIEENDYDRGFLKCLAVLTTVGDVSRETFVQQMRVRSDHCITLVCIDPQADAVCGTASLMIEPKFIHGCSYVGHIEDVAVLPTYGGKGVGKLLIDELKRRAVSRKCYKVILDCHPRVVDFYRKCDLFTTDEVQMRFNPPAHL